MNLKQTDIHTQLDRKSCPSADTAPDLAAVVREGLELKGGWREAIAVIEDYTGDRAVLRNMVAAVDQLDEWAKKARVALEMAEEGRIANFALSHHP